MKKLFSALVVAGVVVCLGVVGCSSPTTTSGGGTPTVKETKPETETKGTFEKYDKDKNMLSVKTDKETKEYDVKGIKPTVDGKADKDWADIKDKANVTVTEKDKKVVKVEAKNP